MLIYLHIGERREILIIFSLPSPNTITSPLQAICILTYTNFSQLKHNVHLNPICLSRYHYISFLLITAKLLIGAIHTVSVTHPELSLTWIWSPKFQLRWFFWDHHWPCVGGSSGYFLVFILSSLSVASDCGLSLSLSYPCSHLRPSYSTS